MTPPQYTLQGFCSEILQILRGLPGENYVPDQPENNPGQFPFGTVYSAIGETKATPAGMVQTDLSDVTIAWVVPLENLATANAYMLPFRELIPRAIIDGMLVNGRSKHAQTPFQTITLSLGFVDWGGSGVMFGWLITLQGVKVQNDIT
jgi:hypothetical protein